MTLFSRDYVFFRYSVVFHEIRSPAAPLLFRAQHEFLGALCFLWPRHVLKRFESLFCFRFPTSSSSSALPGASSADTARPGAIVFLLDPTPYRLLRCNLHADSLCVFPAFGHKKSSFFAPKSTVWTPPRPMHSLAVNTDPLDVEMPPSSPSPVAPPLLPDTFDCGTLTSPVPNRDVACFTDSFSDLEFAALLRDSDENWSTTSYTRRHSGGAGPSERPLLPTGTGLPKDENELRANFTRPRNPYSPKTPRWPQPRRPKGHDYRFAETSWWYQSRSGGPLFVARNASPSDRPDLMYIDKSAEGQMLYRCLAVNRSSTTKEITKNYRKLMRLCHPDRHPHLSRHIPQQVIAAYNLLKDEDSRRIYDCCGIRAVTRKDTTHFCRICNPRPYFESCDDLWTW